MLFCVDYPFSSDLPFESRHDAVISVVNWWNINLPLHDEVSRAG
jgi:hypothetical protein